MRPFSVFSHAANASLKRRDEMIRLLRSRSGLSMLAVLFGLLAAPRAVIAQAQPDQPDLVQLLSEQSYEESLATQPAEAPPAAPRVNARTSTSGGVRKTLAASASGYRCLPS